MILRYSFQVSREAQLSKYQIIKLMFNKLKQIKDLRDQAKTMQNVLAQESVTVEKSGIKLIMNGNMEITSFAITEDVSKEKLEKIIPNLINDAIKDVQKIMAKKIQSMGGLGNLGL